MEAERGVIEAEVAGVLQSAVPRGAAAVDVYQVDGLEHGNDTALVALTPASLAHHAAIVRFAGPLGYRVAREGFVFANGEATTLVLRKLRRPRDLPPNPTTEIIFLLLAILVAAGLFYRIAGL